MSSPFEGMGAILTGTLGDPVIHRPAAGGSVTRRWHLREYPADVFGGERPLQSATIELRVPRSEAAQIQTGDRVETEGGAVYVIGPRVPTPNPASDALVTFELHEANP